jgi:hypothetical protein
VRVEYLSGLEGDASRRHGGDRGVGPNVDRPLLERFDHVLPELRFEHREELRPGLDEDDARLLLRSVRVVLGELRAVELGDRSRRLDPRRAATDDDGVQGAVLDHARVVVCCLPPLDEVILELDGVRQRVHRERVLAGPFGAEEVHLGSEAKDEVVVLDRVDLVEAGLACVEVDGGDAGLMDGGVLLMPDEIAKRVTDGGGLEQARRELVEQRLEGVVVVAVDQHDFGVGVFELLRGSDAREATAEDEHPRPGRGAVVA